MEMKDQRIEIRCTRREKEKAIKLAEDQLMKLSEFILKKLFENDNEGVSSNMILREICALLKEINILEFENPDLQFDEIKRRCSNICHYL